MVFPVPSLGLPAPGWGLPPGAGSVGVFETAGGVVDGATVTVSDGRGVMDGCREWYVVRCWVGALLCGGWADTVVGPVETSLVPGPGPGSLLPLPLLFEEAISQTVKPTATATASAAMAAAIPTVLPFPPDLAGPVGYPGTGGIVTWSGAR
jgi:hypothetical protein